MWITIYTDASVTKGKTSTGAYWIKSNIGRIVERRDLDYNDSNLCELQIARIAIKRAIETHGTITGILLVADNMAVVEAVKKKKKSHHRAEFDNEFKLLWGIIGSHKVRVKHIKGHSGTQTKGKWINDAVDKLTRNEFKHTRYLGNKTLSVMRDIDTTKYEF